MDTIKKTSLSEAVAERLMTLISEGRVEPGGRLPTEPQLCEMLGVSRTAVREGIKALAGINVLTVLAGRGTFVNESQNIMVGDQAIGIALERETVKDIYEVRSVLDAGIAKYATMKASDEDIAVCRAALDKMEKSLESNPVDFEAASEGDEEFHFALCKAAHNKLLMNISWPIINHAVIRNWKQQRAERHVRLGIEGHRLILRALEKRDVNAVLDAVEKHLQGVFENLYKSE